MKDEDLHRTLELESENKTLRADNKRLRRTISQYEQPVPEINLVDGVRNPLIDEAGFETLKQKHDRTTELNKSLSQLD